MLKLNFFSFVLPDGRLAVDFLIDHTVRDINVTVQL